MNSKVSKPRNRTIRWLRRSLTGILFIVLVLPVSGFSYQVMASTIDARQYPPPGKLINIGGYRLHLYCTGQGTSTVILDAGLGGAWLDWSPVQPGIAQFARVCSYDRAGMGWSDSGPDPRDAQQAVTELHTLLHNAAIPPPYVMVGHSNGGLRVQLFADEYPDEVAGMVLVDPTPVVTPSEYKNYLSPQDLNQFNIINQQLATSSKGDTLNLLKTVAPLGVGRLIGESLLESRTPLLHLNNTLQPVYRAISFRTSFLPTYLDEIANIDASINEVRAAKRAYGSIPLIVLVSSYIRPFASDPVTDPQLVQLSKLEMPALQRIAAQTATLSTRGKAIIAQNSGHYIQFDQPDLVIESIHSVVMMVQSDNHKNDF